MLSTPTVTSTNNANSTVPLSSTAMVATAIIAPVVASHFTEEQMVMLTLNTIPFALPKMREQFRNYQDSARQAKVQATYSAMHATQTVEFVRAQHAKWLQFNHTRATIMQCLELLDGLVDDSDPDIALPNSVHAFQSAEMARRVFPEHDWFHLVALIHDLGKVMAMWGAEQFATVGDTYPVGCKPDSSCVFLDTFAQCPDQSDERYNTELGMYQAHTGIDQLLMSWGHDEYMYRVLIHNGSRLPDVGHRIIRYHSFYPWHTHGGYRHLCNDSVDVETLQWVQRFNEFDLYTKSDEIPNVDSIKPYYQSLIDKYIPGTLEW